jgi:acetolactate synthase I/II/III large subunit
MTALSDHQLASDESTASTRITGAEAIVKTLETAGVEFVFGMSGHANLAVLDALANSSIQFVSVPHEQLGVHATDAYYRASGKVGVVLTTLGPGIANTPVALLDAAQDGSAILVLSGNVPQTHAGLDAYQEVAVHGPAAQLDLVRPLVKRAFRITDEGQLLPYLVQAYLLAASAPGGPVAIDLPMDMMSATAEFEPVDLSKRLVAAAPVAPGSAVDSALELLTSAQRPLIYCGGGALTGEAPRHIEALVHRLGVPVATSLIGQAVLGTRDPHHAGCTGSVGMPSAHFACANADVVLLIGSRLSDMDTSSRSADFFFTDPSVRTIHVDIDPAQIGKHFAPTIGVAADASQFVAQLLAASDGRSPKPEHTSWLEEVNEVKARFSEEVAPARASEETPLLVDRVFERISAMSPADTNFVVGIGPRYLFAQHCAVGRRHSVFLASGSGTMGFVPPAAIGIKFARPDEPVVAVMGDGEFKSTGQALAMAAEYNRPVTMIVLNNYSYNVIELYQNKYYGTLNGSVFFRDGEVYSPDYAAMAHSYGLAGSRVETPEELDAALAKAIGSDQTTVLDVIVNRRPKLRASGFWEANKYLTRGWNYEAVGAEIGGFGDQGAHAGWRRDT